MGKKSELKVPIISQILNNRIKINHMKKIMDKMDLEIRISGDAFRIAKRIRV